MDPQNLLESHVGCIVKGCSIQNGVLCKSQRVVELTKAAAQTKRIVASCKSTGALVVSNYNAEGTLSPDGFSRFDIDASSRPYASRPKKDALYLYSVMQYNDRRADDDRSGMISAGVMPSVDHSFTGSSVANMANADVVIENNFTSELISTYGYAKDRVGPAEMTSLTVRDMEVNLDNRLGRTPMVFKSVSTSSQTFHRPDDAENTIDQGLTLNVPEGITQGIAELKITKDSSHSTTDKAEITLKTYSENGLEQEVHKDFEMLTGLGDTSLTFLFESQTSAPITRLVFTGGGTSDAYAVPVHAAVYGSGCLKQYTNKVVVVDIPQAHSGGVGDVTVTDYFISAQSASIPLLSTKKREISLTELFACTDEPIRIN